MRNCGLRDPSCIFVVIGSVAVTAGAGAGCGGVSHRGPPDASIDAAMIDATTIDARMIDARTDGPPPDAPPDAPPVARCDPSKPFGAPMPVTELNSTAVDQGAKLVDDLTMYFGSNRTGVFGLYMATRSSPSQPFATPVALALVNAAGAASGPTLTADGLTLYYALVPTGAQTGDLYVTHRASKADPFPAGSPVANVNDPSLDDLDPFITEDGSVLYFDSARVGASLHLYFALRQPGGSFGAVQAMTSQNVGPIDGHPVLSHDGLTLYWSSTRTDGGAQGITDIWFATRPTTAAVFGAASRIAELSSTGSESLSWISADGCVALLQSTRTGTIGGQDIFQATKPM
jgi:Tol biopolymer transport system component